MAELLDGVSLPSGDYYDFLASGLYTNFTAKPILEVSFTTAANTSYYEAFTIKADKNYVGPVNNPFFIKIESDTTNNSVKYRSVSYVICNNYSNLNMAQCYMAYNSYQNSSYCHYYLRPYYPSTGSNFSTMPIKFCVRNYNNAVTDYKVTVFRVPEGFTDLVAGSKAVVATTNYSAGSDINIRTIGLQETGDSDTVNRLQYYQSPVAGSAIYPYHLYMLDKDGRAQALNISNANSYSTAKGTNRAKMKPGHGIFVYWSSTSKAAGETMSASYTYSSFPCGSTGINYNFSSSCPASTAVYIKGTYDSQKDEFQLPVSTSTNWYTYVPMTTADLNLANYFSNGSYYIYVGHTSTSANDFYLAQDNPLYYFNGLDLVDAKENILDTKYASIAEHPHVNNETWWKVAQLSGAYFNFDVQTTGMWSSGSPSIIDFHVQIRNGVGNITQISGIAGNIISGAKIVKDNNNAYFLLVKADASSTGTFGKQTLFFHGYGVTKTFVDVLTPETLSDYTEITSITFSTISGTSLTSSNYSTYAAAKTHSHAASDITSGTIAAARLPSASTSAAGIIQIGTGATNAAAGNHTHSEYATSDTKVTNTLATTTKSYVTGTATATTSTGTQNFDTGVYLTTTAGQLNATTYKLNEKATMQYDTTNDCIQFVFS